MRKIAVQSAWLLLIVLLAYGWWQRHGQSPSRRLPLEKAQLTVEEATVSTFTRLGAPSEQAHFARLSYYGQRIEDQTRAVVEDLRGHSQTHHITALQTPELHYRPNWFFTDKPIMIQTPTQTMHAQKAQYDLLGQRLLLTESVINYVP